MYEAMVLVSMKFAAYNIKALKQETAETGPLPIAGVPSEQAVMSAEVMPLYPEGEGALQVDIQKNLKYPEY